METNKENKSMFKIKYFPFGGRGTALRLCAFLGKLPFDDEFISFEEFEKIKKHKTIKWWTLPQIHINMTNNNNTQTRQPIIGQSNTCLRFIGSMCNMYPKNKLLAAFCDEVMDCVEDIMLLLAPSEFCGSDSKKKEMRKSLCSNELPMCLQKLEWALEDNVTNRSYKNGFVVGNRMTVADCKLFCFIRHFGRCKWREGYYKYINEDILDTYPLLKAYKEKLMNLGEIKEFDVLWRKRHKGFKLKMLEYPKCYTWNNDNQEEMSEIKNYIGNDENNENNIATIIGYDQSTIIEAIIVFLSSLIWYIVGGDATNDWRSVCVVIVLFFSLCFGSFNPRSKVI